jgi:hypothetical protein
MALVSALLNLPVGVRFVALTKEGVIYLWFFFAKIYNLIF